MLQSIFDNQSQVENGKTKIGIISENGEQYRKIIYHKSPNEVIISYFDLNEDKMDRGDKDVPTSTHFKNGKAIKEYFIFKNQKQYKEKIYNEDGSYKMIYNNAIKIKNNKYEITKEQYIAYKIEYYTEEHKYVNFDIFECPRLSNDTIMFDNYEKFYNKKTKSVEGQYNKDGIIIDFTDIEKEMIEAKITLKMLMI